ncbi:protein-tyrosine-phosphatase [Asimina triloba]
MPERLCIVRTAPLEYLFFAYDKNGSEIAWRLRSASPIRGSFDCQTIFRQIPVENFANIAKRERENPCVVCGHYHKYEEGEVCGICGHRMPASFEKSGPHCSAFPSEILPDFLYLGSYDNASRAELLKTQGISRILNLDTVPACQNLYKNSFTYHCLQEEKTLPFEDAIQFLVTAKKPPKFACKSPAIVIAYLMKQKGWRLAQSYQWVKDRRPMVELSSAVSQQLQEYEQTIFGSTDCIPSPFFPSSNSLSFNFGFSKSNYTAPVPAFNPPPATSIFDQSNNSPQQFTFGAGTNSNNSLFNSPMDSSS